jgi:hypothetical protein
MVDLMSPDPRNSIVVCHLTYTAITPPERYFPVAIQNKYKGKVGTQDFREEFGTHAIVGERKHSTIGIQFSLATLRRSETAEFIAKTSAQFDTPLYGGKISGELNTIVDRLINDSEGDFSLITQGFKNDSKIDVPPFTADLKFGEWSVSALKALQDAKQEPEPYEFILLPYQNIPIDGEHDLPQRVGYPTSLDVATLYALVEEWRVRSSIL